MIKSPFLIIKDFISPLDCENIVGTYDNHFPDVDNKDRDIKTILSNPLYQQRVWERLSDYFDYIEKYYSVEVDSISHMDVEWYPEKCIQEELRCENSHYFAKKWSLINEYDFTVVVFLKDYNDKANFDQDFECYGGKIEFANHLFGINPQRGTAIIFPSNQYFLNRTLTPKAGSLFQLRMHLICTERFKYSPDNYKGNYSIWFKDLT